MTVRYAMVVICDDCGCKYYTRSYTYTPDMTTDVARHEAERIGWRSRREGRTKRDRCQGCSAEQGGR